MTDQEDTQATEPPSPDRAAEVAVGTGRRDDRNEQTGGRPEPDPMDSPSDADDVPEAD